MSGANTYKDHLQYNKKERNVKNIVFVFDQCQNFMDPHLPRHPRRNFDPRQNFIDPHPSSHLQENFDPLHFFWPALKLFEPMPPAPPANLSTYATHAIHAI